MWLIMGLLSIPTVNRATRIGKWSKRMKVQTSIKVGGGAEIDPDG